jgi:hypothetical protein
MSQASQSGGSGEKKPVLPPSRIAVIVFALIAAVVILFELRARSQHDKSYKAIDEAMSKAEESGGGFYKEDLDKLIVGSPSRQMNDSQETLTWTGPLGFARKYRIWVEYGDGGFVQRIERK